MTGRKVCISVDSSKISQETLDWAAANVVRQGDEVHLVTVIEPSVESELQHGVDPMRGLTPALLKNCEADPVVLANTQKFLSACKADLAKKGVDASRISTQPLVACIGNSHDIGRQIIDYTEEAKCESLVMGSRGLGLGSRTVLGLFGLGSVSDYVVKHAGCNVIVHKSAAAVASGPAAT